MLVKINYLLIYNGIIPVAKRNLATGIWPTFFSAETVKIAGGAD